jgi:hypothetical protein
MTDVSRISVGMRRSRSIYGAIKGFGLLLGFIPVDKLIKTEQA